MDIAVLGIDLGKNSCSVVGLDGSAKSFCGVACNAKRSWLGRQALALHHCDGGLLRCPSSGTGSCRRRDTQFG